MTKFSLVIMTFIVAATASAGTRIEAKTWQAVQEFDPMALEKSLGSHTGQWIAVKFNFRGKGIHHLKPNWYEGSIWGPNTQKSGKFSNVRVMVAKKDLPRVQGDHDRFDFGCADGRLRKSGARFRRELSLRPPNWNESDCRSGWERDRRLVNRHSSNLTRCRSIGLRLVVSSPS